MSDALPDAPTGLSEAGRVRFFAVVDHLESRWSNVWTPIVARYVYSMEAADSCLAGIPRSPAGALVLTTEGSQGQQVQHPLWRAWLDASRAAAAAAAELGITPRQMADILPDEDGPSIFDKEG